MASGNRRDPATGRKMRENTRRDTHGGPERRNGKIVPKGRLAHKRARGSGKK